MFKIQEFSKRTGVSKRMLRYLEEQGLLTPNRQQNDYRTYSQEHFEELQWIQFWQRLGFSCSEIKTLKKMDRSEVQNKIVELQTKTKQDLRTHFLQLSLLKEVTQKIQDSTEQKDWSSIAFELEPVVTWPADSREAFLGSLKESDRIVYGPFTEVENFTTLMTEGFKKLGKEYRVQSNIIMKIKKAIEVLPSAEVQVWESKKDYTYFLAVVPDASLGDTEVEKNLPYLLEESLTQTICPLTLDDVGRLFDVRDLTQFAGSQEMSFVIHFQSEDKNDLYILIPFQFIHSNRQGRNSSSLQASRTLQSSILGLSDEQIRKNTRELTSQDFLLTLLLADSPTKHKMLQTLDAETKVRVRSELESTMQKIEGLWKY